VITARTIIAALKGHWHGAYGTSRCPGHDDKSPSLSVSEGQGGTILVKCHAGCEQGAVIDALRRLNLWPNATGRLLLHHTAPLPRPSEPAIGPDDAERSRRAFALWREAEPITGTPAAAYLKSRGIDLAQAPALAHALRWHPACTWESGRHPALVALFTDALTGEAKAIHRTAITPDGRKVGRKMLGAAAGSVIRLWRDDMVTTGLVIDEGVETVLAVATQIEHRGTRLAPAWATASAGAMAKLPVLAGVEALTILVDHDESGTGQRAALEVSQRWTAAGRDVFRLVPNACGQDFNDVVRAAA
jgi:putative DNA primase/helicase